MRLVQDVYIHSGAQQEAAADEVAKVIGKKLAKNAGNPAAVVTTDTKKTV